MITYVNKIRSNFRKATCYAIASVSMGRDFCLTTVVCK